MSDLAELYEHLRKDISELVFGLSPGDLDTTVPATPGWSIRDLIAHLAADATCATRGDLPRQFFAAPGDEDAIVVLNDWTGRQLEDRRGRPLRELLDEWTVSGNELVAMMRSEKPWPEGSLWFIDRVLVTDAAVHQQDIFGALGVNRNRDGAPIKVGLRTYTAGMGLRLASSALAPLRVDTGDKTYSWGDDEPGATVRGTGFELFRAMSGRRSPEQIAAYDWDGDAGLYIEYFYPYGIRQHALVE